MSILARGFGPGGGLISRGQGVAIRAVEAIITYTSQTVKKATRKTLRAAEEVVDLYKITAMLMAVNGNEVVYPKSKTTQGTIDRSKEIIVSINNFAVSNVYKPAYKIVIDVLSVSKGIK